MWVIVRSVFGSVRPKYSNLASAFQDFGDEITWKLPGNLGEVVYNKTVTPYPTAGNQQVHSCLYLG